MRAHRSVLIRTQKKGCLPLEFLEDRRLLVGTPTPDFMETYLVSDQANHALVQDANLVAPWGIGLDSSVGFSISDNATGVATQYGGDVNGSPLVPSSSVPIPGGSPTGQVAPPPLGNGSGQNNGFTITSGSSSAPAELLYANAAGEISGWNPSVSDAAQLSAAAAGANFTGLAFGSVAQLGPLIYAADFHNGRIDVFNSSFQPVNVGDTFTDPNLPAGFAPYNIENLFGQLYVAYAKQDSTREHAVAGPGNGFIDVFSENGTLVSRLVAGTPGQSASPLNAPWGMTIAPTNFTAFGGDLLVANTGDGHINAFRLRGGSYLGAVNDPSGNPMTIDGLRGLTVGNDVSAGNSSLVYFTADPNNGAHGLFGSIANTSGNPLDSVGAEFPVNFDTPFDGAVATFSDVNGNNTGVSAFTTTINWGDGTLSAGAVAQIGANQYLVTGSHRYDISGAYNVAVSIADAHGNTTTAASIASVLLTGGSLSAGGVNFAATSGAGFNGKVATFSDGDGNTSVGDYSAAIDWGDGTTTAGTVSASGSGFQVAGQHTYATTGSDHVVITIHDSDGDSITVTGTATVSASGALNVSAASVAPTEGLAFSDKVATFTDTDASLPSADFLATIDWGDGATTAGTVSASAGRFTVTGAHIYADEGTYTAHVAVAQTAPTATSATATLTVKVADAALTLTGADIATTQSTSFSGTVATLHDANLSAPAGDFSATIDWGDGSTTAGTVNASGPGNFDIVGQHAYAAGGSYNVSVHTNDIGGSTATTSASATIGEYPLIGSPASIADTEGDGFSGTVATFTDANPQAGPASNYSASITWGDGATSAGTITGSAGHYTVQAAHTFSDESSSVTVAIKETGGASTTVTSPAAIADADKLTGSAISVSAVEGQPLLEPLATFSDTYTGGAADDFTATINWGDGTTTAGTVLGTGGHYTVHGRHAYADEGTQTAQVVLRDSAPGTASATATASLSIADAPLVASPYTFYAVANSTFHDVVATFNDANAAAPASDFTATIDWGGGTTSTGNVVAEGGGLFDVVGTRAFGQVGTTAQATVIVHDVGGSSATIQSTAQVVDGTLSLRASPFTATAQSSGTFTVATFTDSGPLDPLSDYSAAIDWGDGGTSAGTISVNGSTLTVTGSHTYSDAGQFAVSVTAREGNGSTASGRATATVLSLGGGTAVDRWINALFEDLLKRPADAGALAYFANLAASAGRGSVVSDILGSTEYLNDEVESLYERYLHRAADTDGLNYFTTMLEKGGGVDQVASAMAASPEFFATQGGGNSSGFLSALFEDALGRPIDPGAQQYFGQELSAGVSRQQVVAAVFSSDESIRDVINGLYEQLLERPADPGALACWAPQLRQGAHQDQIIIGVGQSTEFFDKTS